MPDVSDQRIHPGAGRAWWHVSRTGLFFGAAYFLTSMAPSLLPRTWYYQGLISGLCAVAGYALGVFVAWVVRRVARLIDLRVTVSGEARHWLLVAAPVFGAVAVLGLTVANVRSQARTAAFVQLTPLDPLDWALALALAAVVAVLFLAVARGLRGATHQARRGGRPRAAQDDRHRHRRRRRGPRDGVGDRQRPLPPWHAGLRGRRGAGQHRADRSCRPDVAAAVRQPGLARAVGQPRLPGPDVRHERADGRADLRRDRPRRDRADPRLRRAHAGPLGRRRRRRRRRGACSAPRPSTVRCSRSSRRRAPAGSTTGRPSPSSTSATATARSPRCSTPTCPARCR